MPLPSEILEQIPEEYRDNASLQTFENIGDLAKSFVETKAMVGNSTRRPSEDAGPEAYQEYLNKLINNDPTLMLKPDFANAEQSTEFYRTLGLPDEVSKYTLPESVVLEDEVAAELLGVMFDAKIPQSQVNQIMTAFSDRQKETTDNLQMAREQDETSLKNKWGLAMTDRERAAKQANEDFYPGRDFDALTGAEKESLYNISHAMTGKSAPAAGDAGGIPSDSMTPEEAKAQAAEIMKRLHAKDNDLSREETMRLVRKRIDLLVKYAGYEGSLDSLRA
jgi:hypothetical protein